MWHGISCQRQGVLDGCTIEFGWHLRETLKFDGLEPLLKQMKKDCDLARKLTEA